jgi:hypothetical protein
MFEKFKKNIYSQDGEDGILEEIFNRLKLENLDKTCVEFGAADGMFISNTYNLIKNKNYKALLIEPDKIKFKQLQVNIPDKKIIKINEFVEYDGDNNLDSFLIKYNFNVNFDFLSIDIDGNDYHIFESLKKFQPKVICIEYNNHIPNEVIFVQENNYKLKQGSSALAIINLAMKKGYLLAAMTNNNLIFTHETYANHVLKGEKLDINSLRNKEISKNLVFIGYDGTIHTTKPINLHWHRIEIKKIQALPKILQSYPDDYNLFQKIFYYYFLFKTNPKKYLSNPCKYFRYFLKKN